MSFKILKLAVKIYIGSKFVEIKILKITVKNIIAINKFKCQKKHIKVTVN